MLSGMTSDADSLFLAPLAGMVDWGLVDAFLEARLPEGARIEYREKFDPSKSSSAIRFVDTVGSMANSGGGLILLGVRANDQDIPVDWPTLPHDAIRPGTLHAAIRGSLDPVVAVDIGVARGERGDVVVVRVPDAPLKPVFILDRGVLVRVGESNIPARRSQLADWFSAQSEAVSAVSMDLYRSAPSAMNTDVPVINVAVGPSEAWPDGSWGDATDAALGAIAVGLFPDVPERRVGADLLQFRDSPSASAERWVWFRPNGIAYRMCRLGRDMDGRASALQLAGQVARGWLLAQRAVPVLLPGYRGGLTIVASAGGITAAGLRSDYPMTSRLEDVPPLVDRMLSWQGSRRAVPIDLEAPDVVQPLMEHMLRTFGYSPSAPTAAELAAFALFADALPPDPR